MLNLLRGLLYRSKTRSSSSSPLVGKRWKRCAALPLTLELLEDRLVPSSGTVSGVVFNDYNENGAQDTLEPGVGGVEVSAYNTAGALVAQAMTNATYPTATTAPQLGTYSLTIPGAIQVHVQFTDIPAGYQEGPDGTNSSSVDQYVDSSTNPTNVSLGLIQQGETAPVNGTTPNIAVGYYWYGDPTQTGTTAGENGAQSTIVSTPYTSSGDAPTTTTLADFRQVGATFGLAYQASSNTVFASAYARVGSGYGPGGPGAIYAIAGNGSQAGTTALDYLDLGAIFGTAAVGTNTHPNGVGYNFARDDATYGVVGETSLGGMAISEDGKTLYVMDLQDKNLYAIPLTTGANPFANANATTIKHWLVPDPTNGTDFSDIKPFAVGFDNGMAYVGEVNSAETVGNATISGATRTGGNLVTITTSAANDFQTGNQVQVRGITGANFANGIFTITRVDSTHFTYTQTGTNATSSGGLAADDAQLEAYVYAFDPTANMGAGAFITTPVLSYALTYQRGEPYTGDATFSGNWNPWSDTFSTANYDGNATSTRRFGSYPEPMLSSIAFDNGSMILGMRDRFGDQNGRDLLNPVDTADDTFYDAVSAGDVLRAYPTASSGDTPTAWTIEHDGAVTDYTGATLTGAAGNNQGPGGGRFYDQQSYPVTGNPTHTNISEGGVAHIPGSDSVIGVALDPTDTINAGGTRVWSTYNTPGNALYSAQLYMTTTGTNAVGTGTFAKSNGMSNVTLMIPSPTAVTIGDRVWEDINGNGLQDAGDTGISGVTVELETTTGTMIASAITNGMGYYLFSSAAGTSTGNDIYNLALTANMAYMIVIDYSNTTLNPHLAGLKPTLALVGSNPAIDSNGVDNGTDSVGAVMTPGPGMVNNTFDFGFVVPLVLEGYDYLVPNTTTATGLTTSTTGVPIPGTTVVLTGTDDASNIITKTTTTDASGFYSFTGLNPSNGSGYTVTETPPSSDSHVGQTSTTTGADTNLPSGTPSVVSNIVLTTTNAPSIDNFFESASVSLNGHDYLVSNTTTAASLTTSTTGTVIANTLVTLTGTDDFGTPVSQTMTTNASGFYSFTGLNPSNGSGYTVTETPPTGETHVGQTSTTTGAVTTPPTTPAVTTIVLNGSNSPSTDNFFETANVSLNGYDYLVSNTTTAGSLTTSTTGTVIPGTLVTLTGTDASGNPVSMTMTTNASGFYSFTGLSPSNSSGYTVTETPPTGETHVGQTSTTTGAVASVNPIVSNIVLNGSNSPSTDNFFETATVSLNGNDYLVSNTTTAGSLTTSTTGTVIPGTLVTLTGTDASGNPVNMTMTTNASGFYSFTGLSPSNSSGYTVTETPPTGETHVGQTSTTTGAVASVNPIVSNIVLNGTNSPSTDNFFETANVSLNGYDYLVSNTTTAGSLTTSTTGTVIPGTLVTLTGTDASGNPVSMTMTTNASGFYSFTGLSPSNSSGYTVTETPPTGETHVGQTSTTTGAVASVNPIVSNIVLNGTNSPSTDNFFETATVSLNGHDYLVSNTTTAGSLTTSTTGTFIPGTVVTLTGTDASGNPVSMTMTTNASGFYSFTGLSPSNSSGYTVTETPPSGETHVGQTSTTTGAVASVNPIVSNIVLNGTNSPSTDNFFETANVSLNGYDYLVSNTTTAGSLTTSTTGTVIPGTLVTLTGTDASGNPVSMTMTTNASGFYSFTGLSPSNSSGYTVTETPPTGETHVGQTSTTTGAVASVNPIVSNIVLNGTNSPSTDNFFETATVSLNGYDYLVSNTTTAGSLTTSTTGTVIPGTVVTLTGTDASGNSVSKTATTDTNGFYSFTGLSPSNSSGYTVTETPPSIDTHVGQTSTTVGANTSVNPIVSNIVLNGTNSPSTDNFFESASVSLNGHDYLVSNTTTAASLTTSTTGTAIPGTLVTLTGTDEFDNTVSKTTTTNSSGFYSFTGLNPSNGSGYTVTETPPTGETHVGQTSTTTGAVTSVNPIVSNIVLATSNSPSTDNFFETATVSLNGHDYLVSNTTMAANLTTSTTGTVIPGTVVTLTGTDASGNSVSKTATTDTNGFYSFTGLSPSNGSGYTVTETPPSGETHVGQTSTTTGAVASVNPIVSNIVLNGTNSPSTDNFFETASVSLNGYDYLVSNTTTAGSLTTSTTGTVIPGTLVTLTGTDASGNSVSKTTTTNASGFYSFTGLSPSNGSGYTVTETPPTGETHVGQTSTTTGAVASVNPIVSNIVLNGTNSPSTDNFFETATVSLNGYDYLVSNTTTSSSLTTSTTGAAITGTLVTLTGTDASGNPVSMTMTTNVSGFYSFTGLSPSNSSGYTVTETPPSGDSHVGQTSTTTGAVTTPPTTPAVTTIVLTGSNSPSTDNFFENNTVSLNGYDYLVSNTTTPGSLTTSTTGTAIPGTLVTLTGTDEFNNTVSQTMTTNASGFYSFTGLNQSNGSGYTVTETPPASDSHVGQTSTTTGAITNTPPGTPSVVSKIVLTTSDSPSTDNFFETASVSINGNDYLVSNTTTSGSLTTSTTGVAIAGTLVTLTGTDALGNTVSETTTTNSSGSYSFTGLNPSNASGYTVTETPPASDSHLGQTSTTTGTTTNTPPGTPAVVSKIVLTTNGSSSTDNYFETANVSLNGNDYLVSNTIAPGSLTTSTTGIAIPGTLVTLTGTDDFGNPISQTMTTNASGFYSFTGLNPSNASSYTVTETPPASDSHVGQTSTTTGTTTNTPPGTPSVVSKIVLNTSNSPSTDNFFETRSVTINGTDYLVPNTTTAGSLTTSTTGNSIAGTTLTLTGTDEFGNVVSVTTTTNASGQYSFTGLDPSNSSGYTVTESPSAGHNHVGQTSTTDGADTNTPPGTPSVVSTIVLTSNGATSTDNFFESGDVSLNGYDYLVSNSTTPGSLETSTTGIAIPNTLVTLTGTDAFGNTVSQTTTTNASGFYSFTGLNPSNASGFTLTETPPTSDSHVGQTSTTAGASTNTPPGTPSVVSNIVLMGINSPSTDNFFETRSVTINGTDYLVPSTTTPGSLTTSTTGTAIPNTTITLTGTDEFGNPVNNTTTTNGNGQYSFTGLNPSNGSGYTVTETPPVNDMHLGQTSTTVGAVTTPPSTPVVSSIVLTGNGSTSTDNFFETPGVTGTSSVSGYVYRDLNVDGIREPNEGETGIGGTTITLTGTTASGVSITLTMTTDSNGFYDFTNLPQGTYTVTESPPTGFYYEGLITPGSLGGTVNFSPRQIASIVLPINSTSVENDFGTNPPADPFGYVFVDSNGNGIRDFGEPGVPGVPVTISGVAFPGTPLAHTLTSSDIPGGSLTIYTDSNGYYQFTTVPPGTYVIQIGVIPGFASQVTQDGDPSAVQTVVGGSNFFSNIVLSPSIIRGPFNFAQEPFQTSSAVSKVSFLASTTTLPSTSDVPVPNLPMSPSFTVTTGNPNTPTFVVTGAGTGFVPEVRVFNYATGGEEYRFFAYAPTFMGGVRVAVGDTNGDGVPDIITAPGAGGGPQIRVFDGATGQMILSFFAFDPNFTGGVYVTAADLYHNGYDDIIVGAGAGGGPNVKVFDGKTGALVGSFMAYDPLFTGGVQVAAGDLTGTGAVDIVTVPGAGGGPNVKVFNGQTYLLISSFMAFDPNFMGGLSVAVANVNGGTGGDSIITGAGPGGGPQVRVFDGKTFALDQSFMAFDPLYTGGVNVAAADITGDGMADLIVGAATNAPPEVRILQELSLNQLDDFYAYDPQSFGGVFVA